MERLRGACSCSTSSVLLVRWLEYLSDTETANHALTSGPLTLLPYARQTALDALSTKVVTSTMYICRSA